MQIIHFTSSFQESFREVLDGILRTFHILRTLGILHIHHMGHNLKPINTYKSEINF